MCTIEDDAVLRESVDYRRACDEATIATECVVTLLIGGDEENLSTHYADSIMCFNLLSPSPAAPATTMANASGSMSVEYTTVHPP